ncbi:MAG: hypothetical protein MHM6MM_007924 [Cercozoa sp. M6MM]
MNNQQDEQQEFFEVPDTSALVLGLCDPERAYPTPEAAAYLRHVDLSKGAVLGEKIEASCVNGNGSQDDAEALQLTVQRLLRDQAMLRKYRLRTLLAEQVQQGACQLISVGAGIAPSEIDFVAAHQGCTAIGVDYSESSLQVKRRIIAKACPDVASKVDFLTADARNPEDLMQKLRQSTLWNNSSRKIWLLEGLVYYITEDETVRLMKSILSRGESILVDWARPDHEVSERHRLVVKLGTEVIAQRVGLTNEQYQRMDVDRVAQLCGADLAIKENSFDIEQMRIKEGLTAPEHAFYKGLDGALGVALLTPQAA